MPSYYFLPYLFKAGEKAAEEAGKKLGAEAWEQAKALWAKLKPKVEARPAVQEVAAHPEDQDARAALRLQLRKLLAEDESLAREVQQMLGSPAVWQVIANGERSIAIGSDVNGSVIVTGVQNVVQSGQYPVSIGQASGVTIGEQAGCHSIGVAIYSKSSSLKI